MKEKQTILIGSDHAGFELKKSLIEKLSKAGILSEDLGPYTANSVDYPDFAFKLATRISEDLSLKGILICGTGIGMSIAANKVKNVRAAIVHSLEVAKLAKEHNDANIVILPARVKLEDDPFDIVLSWLESDFTEERHKRRVNKIILFENQNKSC